MLPIEARGMHLTTETTNHFIPLHILKQILENHLKPGQTVDITTSIQYFLATCYLVCNFNIHTYI